MELPAAQHQHQQQLRSLRDFLLVYNRMTELCFQRCVCNLNYRALAREEVSPDGRGGEARRRPPQPPRRPPTCPSRSLRPQEACLEGCAGKLVRSNHRLMAAYVDLMPALLQRRLADYEAADASRPADALAGP
ncbi:mitochondrial import inner membrane translocase subunit Tim10 B isoform X1 [Heteronotia binoei]|uniref:mitochondrial import inner membrane translocase subunit Tim10 B isoform X1 n=1 Tax=Heteronotia binoei TaxID=13085 RepID=UPI00292D3C21|nr:mitochondrial import inner membrane translocase subunit Tim10 B isoform X1 [Heteronotia binoei]